MKTILSDIALPQLPFSENVSVFDTHKLKQTAPCTGCFSCWIKSPGACIFQDDIASFTASMKQSDTLYILTEIAYGSENEQEQNVLQALVQANGVNMDCRYVQCHHCADSEKALVRLQTMLEVAV